MQVARISTEGRIWSRRAEILLSLLVLSLPTSYAAGRSVGALPPGAASGPSCNNPDPTPFDLLNKHAPDTAFDCPLENRLFADAADGRLDEFSLLGAALVAGGLRKPEVLDHYLQRQAALVDELRKSEAGAAAPRRRVEAVFEFMHRRILHGGYCVHSTDLRIALDEGRFNCVSASVLFNCLAEELGLAVCGLEIPGHAMSRVVLPDGTLDIETTCPCWFRLSGDPKRQAEMVEKRAGRNFAEVRWQAREVADIEMVAMIYYNLGVDLLAEKQFRRAAVANAKALRLDPLSTTAEGNLLATINNWAIALGDSQRYREAVELLRQGLRIAPEFDVFALNYAHLHHKWVESLCTTGQFQRALHVLSRAGDEVPSQKYFRRAPLQVYRRWAGNLFDQGHTGRALAVLDEARRLYGSGRELREAEGAGSSR